MTRAIISAVLALVLNNTSAKAQLFQGNVHEAGVSYSDYDCAINDVWGEVEEFGCLAIDNASLEAKRDTSLSDPMWNSFGTYPSALAAGERNNQPPPPRLELPIVELRRDFEPYASYCRRHPDHCDLSGPSLAELNPDTRRLLQLENSSANDLLYLEISDQDLYNHEEYWAFPSHGAGDCEDVALFKRESLVGLGIPRGAMTIAIVHHRSNMSPHAVLLVETTRGTYLLDTLENEVVLWHEAPYNFESRERQDGSWERYDQSTWKYE